MNKPVWSLLEEEKAAVSSLLKKGREEEQHNDRFAIVSFEELYALFAPEEIALFEKFQAIDPSTLDYKLPFLGIEKAVDLVALSNQHYEKDGRYETIPTQYLPRVSFEAFTKLNEAMYADLGKHLLVLYGYRSPARQIFLFFDHLERTYNFDFEKTLERVCFPDYSEHVCPSHQAMDFITEDGVKGTSFAQTPEYAWLKNHAGEYGFAESYFEGNALGMMWEPWHWRYQKK